MGAWILYSRFLSYAESVGAIFVKISRLFEAAFSFLENHGNCLRLLALDGYNNFINYCTHPIINFKYLELR